MMMFSIKTVTDDISVVWVKASQYSIFSLNKFVSFSFNKTLWRIEKPSEPQTVSACFSLDVSSFLRAAYRSHGQSCRLKHIKHAQQSFTLSPPAAPRRNRTTFAASSPTTWSLLCCSSRSAAATRWSTSGCWRTSECGVPASPTDRRTLASCRGNHHSQSTHLTMWSTLFQSVTSCSSYMVSFITCRHETSNYFLYLFYFYHFFYKMNTRQPETQRHSLYCRIWHRK